MFRCSGGVGVGSSALSSGGSTTAEHALAAQPQDGDELDQVIMTALFKAQHLSPTEQLSLALTWNRCDIARKEIFIYGQEWPAGALEHAMQDALENDRVDFVRLLLETGVNMNKFLTINRLERLYNSKKGPANTLEYIVRDVVPTLPKNYNYTLIDIGLVINHLMGSGYRSSYTRRKFRVRYEYSQQRQQQQQQQQQQSPTSNPPTSASFTQNPTSRQSKVQNMIARGLQKTNTEIHFKIPSLSVQPGSGGLGGPNGHEYNFPGHPDHYMTETFEYPFSELIIWAVLTKRKEMAKLMWRHGEQAMAKALVASRLCQAMANEAADDDLDVEIYDELTNFGKEFESLGKIKRDKMALK